LSCSCAFVHCLLWPRLTCVVVLMCCCTLPPMCCVVLCRVLLCASGCNDQSTITYVMSREVGNLQIHIFAAAVVQLLLLFYCRIVFAPGAGPNANEMVARVSLPRCFLLFSDLCCSIVEFFFIGAGPNADEMVARVSCCSAWHERNLRFAVEVSVRASTSAVDNSSATKRARA
jgi:hypothetical protein